MQNCSFRSIMSPLAQFRAYVLNPRMRTLIALSVLCLSIVISAGCNRNPQKFLAKGDQSFGQGKYSEALIYYGRALQLDPRLAEGHYKLAMTQIKLKSLAAAYNELQRTVELQPENWKAQLTLGQLQLAAGQRTES